MKPVESQVAELVRAGAWDAVHELLWKKDIYLRPFTEEQAAVVRKRESVGPEELKRYYEGAYPQGSGGISDESVFNRVLCMVEDLAWFSALQAVEKMGRDGGRYVVRMVDAKGRAVARDRRFSSRVSAMDCAILVGDSWPYDRFVVVLDAKAGGRPLATLPRSAHSRISRLIGRRHRRRRAARKG